MSKKERILAGLGIMVISANLRAPITAVGPVVDMLKEEFGLSNGMAGFITTLPLMAFALVSPFVGKLIGIFGYRKTMSLGLFLMGTGIAIRSFTNIFGLFLGTGILGVGIAVGNILLPSLIKLKFPDRVGAFTGVLTTSMSVFAALGAGLSYPLAKTLDLGWESAIGIWIIPIVLALGIWLLQGKVGTVSQGGKVSEEKIISKPIWKVPMAWGMAIFMGSQSVVYYSLVAWLPSIVVSKGFSEAFAGNIALILQLVGIWATLTIPVLCDKFQDQRKLVFVTCSFYFLGILLLLLGEKEIILIISAVCLSSGSGGAISLAMAFMSMRSPTAARASQLSGMAQSVGYVFAAIGPVTIGIIFDLFQSWTLSICLMGGLIIVHFLAGLAVGRNIVIEG